jgi:hypothetical protein
MSNGFQRSTYPLEPRPLSIGPQIPSEVAGHPVVVSHRNQGGVLLGADGLPFGAPGVEAAAGRDVQRTGDFSG